MKCAYCGAELMEGSLYCNNCGKAVQIVPDYNEFDDYLDNLVGTSKTTNLSEVSSTLNSNYSNNNNNFDNSDVYINNLSNKYCFCCSSKDSILFSKESLLCNKLNFSMSSSIVLNPLANIRRD